MSHNNRIAHGNRLTASINLVIGNTRQPISHALSYIRAMRLQYIHGGVWERKSEPTRKSDAHFRVQLAMSGAR